MKHTRILTMAVLAVLACGSADAQDMSDISGQNAPEFQNAAMSSEQNDFVPDKAFSKQVDISWLK